MRLIAAIVALLCSTPVLADEPLFRWAVSAEAGMSFALLDDTELGDALRDFGYELSEPGFRGAVTVDRGLTDWLQVGGSLSLDTFSDVRARDQAETSLTRITLMMYAQASLCIATRCEPDFGLFFSPRVAIGAGPTMWTLRDETTSAAHIVIEPSIAWDLAFDHFGLGVRIGYGLTSQLAIGPLDLTTGFVWSPSVQMRVTYRW